MTAARPRRALGVDAALGGLVALLSAVSLRFVDYQPPGRMGPDRGPWGHGPPGPPGAREAAPVLPAETVSWPVAVPALLVLAAGVAVRRIFPRAGYAATVVGVAGYLLAGGPYGPVLLAPLLAVHAMAVSLPLSRWLGWLAALPVMLSAGFWPEPYGGLLDPGLYAAVIFGSAVIVAPALFALVRRARQEADARDRAAERDRYLYSERLRMAREVHDVVGHSLSVINLQAGVALHVLDRKPEQAGAALEAIRSSSKDALAELRQALGMFRDTDQRGPGPGLDRLPELVSAVREAGRTVELRVADEARIALPGALDHAAYRIVQEALTNVVRHAPGASAVIEITRDDHELGIRVSDDGPAVEPADLQVGNGILGMTERASAVGGTVEVGAGPAGGVMVSARLPLAPSGRS